MLCAKGEQYLSAIGGKIGQGDPAVRLARRVVSRAARGMVRVAIRHCGHALGGAVCRRIVLYLDNFACRAGISEHAQKAIAARRRLSKRIG